VCTFDFPKFSFLLPNGKMVWKRIRNLDLEKEMEQFGEKKLIIGCSSGSGTVHPKR
jgi:hypothetical protein